MLRFSRPKGPGFGISKAYYLSVLAARASMPSLIQTLNPAGEGSAVIGLGVPLAAGATKETLSEPMERGAYGLATKDRKTVLQMLVLSKEEAGFDSEAVARHASSLGLSDEMLARIRATWTLLQLRFESHDPAVYPAVDFLLAIASRLGFLTDGVVADPLSRRYRMPGELFMRPRINPLVDAREHVAVEITSAQVGIHVYTQGMQKFAQPELEIQGLEPGSEIPAERLLIETCQRALEGKLVSVGQRVGRFEVVQGGFDPRLWEGVPCLELIPSATMTPSEALS